MPAADPTVLADRVCVLVRFRARIAVRVTGIEQIAADSATLVSVEVGWGILTRKVTVSLKARRSTVEHITRQINDLDQAFLHMGLA